MSTSATNERQIAARNKQLRRDRLNDEVVTKSLMSTSSGRRWVWLRLSEGSLWQEDMDLDFARMAHAKGVRNAALRLLKDVTAFCPVEYITMTEEAASVVLHTSPQDEEETPDE